MPRSLADWLRWQESLNPREIDLGLERVGRVAQRLSIEPPRGAVFTVAGTNGKGSTVACLDRLLTAGAYRTGVYTSPHLVRYNERICIAGEPVGDAVLTEAFERIEAVRGDVPLTFFEYGTLAALTIFTAARCDAWILEVGLGGRLDAVNIVDPDFSLITTIAFDHQDWLGESLEDIAAEKAGILRSNAAAFYGDAAVPAAIVARAAELGARLYCLGRDYELDADGATWSWHGMTTVLDGLRIPAPADAAHLRNIGLALAVLEHFDATLLTRANVDPLADGGRPDGRFQVVAGEPQWILDVAHNQQAAGVLRDRIAGLDERRATTAVIGILADKQLDEFVMALSDRIDRWIVAALEGPRAADGGAVADRIATLTGRPTEFAGAPAVAFERAVQLTPPDGRVVCCGSFRIVGPAIEWLGLYS